MPRDLEAELARRRAATDAFFAARPAQIDTNIDKTRSDIGAARDQFFSGTLSPYLDKFGSAGAASVATYKGRLGREMNRSLADRKRRESLTRVDQVYQNALRRAADSGLANDAAIDYARQVAGDEQRRQFEAQQSALDRQSALRKSDTADLYSQLGSSAGSTGVDYESAIIRALFGLGSAAGTGYLLNRKRPSDPTSTPSSSGTTTGGTPSLYNPRPYSDLS